MKLASYVHEGVACYGSVVAEGIVDLSRRIGARYPDIRALLAADALEAASQASAGEPPDLQLAEARLLPAVPNPGKILCVGLNYDDHRKEGKHEKTAAPAVFVRFAESQVGHAQPMLRPRESQKFDFEGEIAVIIGKGGRRIDETDAWACVAGYSCYNDGSVRDWQHATTQWTAGKNFAATGCFGPWVVTADEIRAGSVLTLATRLNGVEMQRSSTDLMIHPINRLISHISTWIPLAAGDVIVTGTPGGVGARREPPVWLKPGDVVEVEVDRIGVLRNTVADD